MTEHWNMLGNFWAVDMLKEHILHKAVRHAYLFSGPSGLGRRTLALRFAQALNCTEPPGEGEACLTCRTCRQIEAMQYPDLAVVQSEREGGVLKVEQVREAQHSLSLKPYQGAFRVAVFLRFQEANLSAANALLKTLEEAPSYAVLILTADAPEQLLPTIVSRCEVLRLRPLRLEAVEAYVQEHGVEADRARLLARLSGGRPGYALRLQKDPSALEFRDQRMADLTRLLQFTRRERFAYADNIARDKEAFRGTLLLWLSFWRDVLLKAAGSSTPVANVDREEEIRQLAGRLPLKEARQRVADLEEAIARLERNVNARLLAEVLLLDWPHLSKA